MIVMSSQRRGDIDQEARGQGRWHLAWALFYQRPNIDPKPGIWRGTGCVSPLSSLTGMGHKLSESTAREKTSEPERDAGQELQGGDPRSILDRVWAEVWSLWRAKMSRMAG